MIGGQGSAYQEAGSWQVAAGYRWQKSDRHFRGIHEEPNRQEEGSEVINRVHLLDLTGSYALTERLNVTLSVPVVTSDRSQAIRNPNRDVVGRFSTQSSGIGDISIVARRWMFDTKKYQDQNLSIGLGIKIPTGKDDTTDTFTTFTGTAVRTVDQSIQNGDGGWGAIVDIQAFKLVTKDLTLFGSGVYLFNPRGTNGVPTFRSDPAEAIMSVADQYVARLGFAAPISRKIGLSMSLAGRVEGAPVTDVFGPSDGFRRPGYAFSVEPGIILSKGKSTVSFYVPIALKRNRQQSVPDMVEGDIGDAAFADYLILSGYSYRF